jgi:hypothetical protein
LAFINFTYFPSGKSPAKIILPSSLIDKIVLTTGSESSEVFNERGKSNAEPGNSSAYFPKYFL